MGKHSVAVTGKTGEDKQVFCPKTRQGCSNSTGITLKNTFFLSIISQYNSVMPVDCYF